MLGKDFTDWRITYDSGENIVIILAGLLTAG